jgi:hypothetical protein
MAVTPSAADVTQILPQRNQAKQSPKLPLRRTLLTPTALNSKCHWPEGDAW